LFLEGPSRDVPIALKDISFSDVRVLKLHPSILELLVLVVPEAHFESVKRLTVCPAWIVQAGSHTKPLHVALPSELLPFDELIGLDCPCEPHLLAFRSASVLLEGGTETVSPNDERNYHSDCVPYRFGIYVYELRFGRSSYQGVLFSGKGSNEVSRISYRTYYRVPIRVALD